MAAHPFQTHANYGTCLIDLGFYLNESCLGFCISDWEDAGRIINGGGRSVWESKQNKINSYYYVDIGLRISVFKYIPNFLFLKYNSNKNITIQIYYKIKKSRSLL